MSSADRVWLVAPHGQGEPREVEATPEVLVPLMVAGHSQCPDPETNVEVTPDVHE